MTNFQPICHTQWSSPWYSQSYTSDEWFPHETSLKHVEKKSSYSKRLLGFQFQTIFTQKRIQYASSNHEPKKTCDVFRIKMAHIQSTQGRRAKNLLLQVFWILDKKGSSATSVISFKQRWKLFKFKTFWTSCEENRNTPWKKIPKTSTS